MSLRKTSSIKTTSNYYTIFLIVQEAPKQPGYRRQQSLRKLWKRRTKRCTFSSMRPMQIVLYCSKPCQWADWYLQHKIVCSSPTTSEKVPATLCSDGCCSPPSLSASYGSPCSPTLPPPTKRSQVVSVKQKEATEATVAKQLAKDAKEANLEAKKLAKDAKAAMKTRAKEAEMCAVHEGYDRAVRALSIEEPIEGIPKCENSFCKSPHEKARFHCKDCGHVKKSWYCSEACIKQDWHRKHKNLYQLQRLTEREEEDSLDLLTADEPLFMGSSHPQDGSSSSSSSSSSSACLPKKTSRGK